MVIGYDEETGDRIYAPTIYAYSVPELDRKKAEVLDALEKGTYANDKKETIRSWADKWFKTFKASSGIKTKEMYNRLVYSHIIPTLGDIRLRDLKKSDIRFGFIKKRHFFY